MSEEIAVMRPKVGHESIRRLLAKIVKLVPGAIWQMRVWSID
jgi:hypothetical protein